MKTNKTVILEEILTDINLINWSSDLVKSKAIKFISNFINVSYIKYKSLLEVQHLTNNYWNKVIGGKTDHIREIKRKLVSNEILNEFVGLYTSDKRTKSYLLNNKYINNNFNHIIIADPFYKPLEINEIQEIENYTKSILNDVKVTKGSIVSEKGSIVSDMINTIKVIEETEEDYFINIKINDIDYRYNINNAILFAKQNNSTLISFGNKKLKYYFVKDLEQWKETKAIDLSIYYTRQLFNIENNIIYANRNETNNRLDTNLTNLKSDLWKYLTLDNEELLEIDIINAQFAILSHLFKVDDLFYELSIEGKLYEYIAEHLNITRQEAKGKMFRIAFDKISNNQNDIRELFPETMSKIDAYKKQNGYKAFSNLLQNTESNIMIDNVLFKLMKKYRVVTVHDSVRCKVSDYNNVLREIQEIFNTLNFKCTLNNKTNTEDISEPVIESNIESNTNTLEDIESTQMETETIDYVMKKQLRDSIINKLSKMYNYSMVSNLQFRPILNKVIDDAYELIVDGKVLNENILQELLIKNK